MIEITITITEEPAKDGNPAGLDFKVKAHGCGPDHWCTGKERFLGRAVVEAATVAFKALSPAVGADAKSLTHTEYERCVPGPKPPGA